MLLYCCGSVELHYHWKSLLSKAGIMQIMKIIENRVKYTIQPALGRFSASDNKDFFFWCLL